MGGRALLLNEHAPGLEQLLHSAARRWGKGFLIADGLGYRFDAPAALTWLDAGLRLRYDCGPLQLHVQRRVTDEWSESYELQQPDAASRSPSAVSRSARRGATSTSPARLPDQRRPRPRLDRRRRRLGVGGADGRIGPGLGLQLTEGELWAYSVESRDALHEQQRPRPSLPARRPTTPARRTPSAGSRSWSLPARRPAPAGLVAGLARDPRRLPRRPHARVSCRRLAARSARRCRSRLAPGAADDVAAADRTRAWAALRRRGARRAAVAGRLPVPPAAARLAERRRRLPARPAAAA